MIQIASLFARFICAFCAVSSAKPFGVQDIQELLGPQSAETTMVYAHVVRELKTKARGPLDTLPRGGPTHQKWRLAKAWPEPSLR
jgi:hypothetical protein